jgi:hypothetical protein
MITPLTTEQQKLADMMSEISEELYYATWLNGLEYYLWSHHRTELIEQANEIGGWIIWLDDDVDPALAHQPDEWGEKFIPMNEWLKMYEKYNNNSMKVFL